MSLLTERANASYTLWALHVTVGFGILAYLTTARAANLTIIAKVILTIIFVGSSYLNLNAHIKVEQQKRSLVKIAETLNTAQTDELAESTCKFLSTFPPEPLLVPYHIIIDILVVVMIWIMPKLAAAKQKKSAIAG